MKVEKIPVVSHRIRRIPPGFGWVDHRFVREGHYRECSTDALALYLLLTSVSDRDGLSYYSDRLLCTMLGWSRKRLETARENLERADLLGWLEPVYQVLELPERREESND